MSKLIEIKSLNTFYGESHILRDIDLSVKAGEMVCVIGRNGVGKTTLLKSLIGLLKTKSGEINFLGENINRLKPHQRARKGIAYVPQGREIIPYLTVEENLMLGMERIRQFKSAEMMEVAFHRPQAFSYLTSIELGS